MNFFFELEHFVITGSNPTIFFLSPAVSNEEKALKHNKRIVKSEIACKKPLGEGQGQSNAGSSSSSLASATASNLQTIQTLTAQQGLLNMGLPGASTSGPVGQPMVQYPWSTTGGQGQSNTGSSSSSLASPTASNLQSIQTLNAQQGLLKMGSPGASASGPVGQPMVQYPWSTTGAPSITSSAHQASVQARALRALARAGAGLPGMNPAEASAAYAEIKLSLQAQQAKGGQQTRNPPATGSQKIDSDDTEDSFDNKENENEVGIIL